MSKIDSIKINILAWYPFKKDCSILYFKNKESNKIEEYLKSISKKIKVIDENINNLDIQEKYDYIILLGTLEYANEIIKDKNNPFVSLLEFAKSKLKEDGTILLAIDNRIGVKYLVGNKSKHCEKIYDSIKNKYKVGKMFTKSEISNIIEQSGFKYKKFYYPLPNYEYTNIIYTDELLPNKNDSKINYNVLYDEDSLIIQDETALLKQFLREGNFKEYTNSYFIELSNTQIQTNIQYISYNNMRKDEYSLILKIYNNTVEKQIKNEISKHHLEKIKENTLKLKELGFCLAEKDIQEKENTIVEDKINLPLLDSYIVSLIKNNNIEKVYNIIDHWYKYIKERLNIDENGFVRDGFIDLVFENTFYNENNDSFIFFDQEWIKDNIPINFIMYRAIKNIYEHNRSLNNYLPIEEMKKRYNIDEKQEFKEIENELQVSIIDEEKRNFYGEQYKYIISSEELLKIICDLKRFDSDNVRLINELEKVKRENEKLKMEIRKIEKSSFWDILKIKFKNNKKLEENKGDIK